MGKKRTKSEVVAAEEVVVAEAATADAAVAVETAEAAVAAQPAAAELAAAETVVETVIAEASAEAATKTLPEVSPAEAGEASTETSTAEASAAPSDAPAVDTIPLRKALESLLFITDHPLTLQQLCKYVGVPQKQSKRVTDAIAEIKADLDEKSGPVQLVEVADGFQMGTRPNYAPIVKKLYTEKMTMRLSTAAHETLAIIAYKQPLTRAEIEQIRGVEVIAALETLVEKKLIEVVGRRETVGRPLMYGTTMEFLRHFGLRSLEDLPPIDSFVVEDAPLGARDIPATDGAAPAETATETPAETPAETEQPVEVLAAEAAEAPAETKPEKPLPSCVEAQSKEFAAGEEMAAEREAEEAVEAEPETPPEPVEADAEQQPEEPKRKSIWE